MPHFTTSDGLSLHFTDTGTGQPLLCLPGLTRCGRDFDFFAPHAQGQRLITLDYRGRGQSEYDPNYSNYNVPREAQDVVELLDHLGLERVTILGTSRGGLIAMMLAATAPDRLAGVILNDVGPVVGAAGIARIFAYLGKAPVSKTIDQAAAALKGAMEGEFPGVPLSRWRDQAAIQYDQTGDGLALRYDTKLLTALMEQAAAGPTPDLWPLFDALGPIPTGVIRGANSDILEPETLAEMQTRKPDLLVAEIPDRGHVPFLDEAPALTLIHRITEMSR